jgi:hypothetical protein
MTPTDYISAEIAEQVYSLSVPLAFFFVVFRLALTRFSRVCFLVLSLFLSVPRVRPVSLADRAMSSAVGLFP